MTAPPRLRPYLPTDYDACLALFDANVPTYFAPEERGGYVAFLQTLDVAYFVVEDNGAVIAAGGVGLRDVEARMCWGIVHADRHREGLGRLLLLVRILRGAAMGATRVGLDTIPKTVPFFERFGFVVVRSIDNGYGPGIHRRDLELALDDSRVATLRDDLRTRAAGHLLFSPELGQT